MVPSMTPAPGTRVQRFVGDRLRFTVKAGGMERPTGGWRALLRTNLGRAEQLREEILQAHTQGLPLAGASWRDVPLAEDGDGWSLELPLAEVGWFRAKAYLLDPRGWQHWPEGPDFGISVHPDRYRTANTLYCAFTRLFGATKALRSTLEEETAPELSALDQRGYTVIPPSGKLRDLTAQLPHIIDTLGCRILHLLPVNPTPTTFARLGRFGSPYAALDLSAIDPALVVFDRRSTGVDQFRELTGAAHLRSARVFLDLVINHTGWSSILQEQHPEWFLREPDGTFVSPGAWGTTWEDLIELKHQNVGLWDNLADVFLTWCRRGVDGFRCDAGYMVPVPAWQYIVARVQQEYPETLFFLEGLGGAWEATEALLTEGGMQWAYSELFQNYSGVQVAGYLDHSLKQCQRVGLLVHYSETHDNARLAARGRTWSLLRNRLCALTSVGGGFGFTCGVEWLAPEKIRVHGSSGLAWGSEENLLPELAKLNRLLADNPCFFDGAKLTRLSPADSPVYALWRESAEGKDAVLVLINTDPDQPHTLSLNRDAGLSPREGSAPDPTRWVDLLGQSKVAVEHGTQNQFSITLAAGAACCLAPSTTPQGIHGDAYRCARAQASWATMAMHAILPETHVGYQDWQSLSSYVDRSPAQFLAAISQATSNPGCMSLTEALNEISERIAFPRIVTWSLLDRHRITPVPPGHWLLIQDTTPFRASLNLNDGSPVTNLESVPTQEGHVVCFTPRQNAASATLKLERYATQDQPLPEEAAIRFLAPLPQAACSLPAPDSVLLLTNGCGGMARLCVDVGRVLSKYDCVLGANLHPALPVDRHVFVKRIRVWINAVGFVSPLDFRSLASFEAGPPAAWNFIANAGDGQTVEIRMTAEMIDGHNATVFRFSRPTAARASGKQLPAGADVRLTVRFDIEDRNFHAETKHNGGAEHHFSTHTQPLSRPPGPRRSHRTEGRSEDFIGFAFTPTSDRRLRVFADSGCYHSQPEWSDNIPHPVEQTRGQVGGGDAYSPGWFELPLPKGGLVTLVATADPADPPIPVVEARVSRARPAIAEVDTSEGFEQQLLRAALAFVVRRDGGKTVIAGYPWFLDWGRDTFICARGLIAAGLSDEVRQMLLVFARFERDGTLPNTIYGDDASNRDTSDAPLWFGLASEELAAAVGETGPAPPVLSALESIARHYCSGTPNGIRMDPASALIWSPSHFTWMDTNYPAGSPREGYPIEIQALWIRLLRYLAHVGDAKERRPWEELAAQAMVSLERLFWLEDCGYYADVLLAHSGQPAAQARADDALRSNCLLPISLGLAAGARARRCVEAARRYLVVPGALRSLAPLPVSVPMPVYGGDGRLLNNPNEPYWGRYEGDEDTRRKPAYHNGTAWTWTFPVFCEALARAWDCAPEVVAAAKAYLGSMDRLLAEGCIGQVPEIVDGDAPHTQRGCDAQAWGATEALRVWHWLRQIQPPPQAKSEAHSA